MRSLLLGLALLAALGVLVMVIGQLLEAVKETWR